MNLLYEIILDTNATYEAYADEKVILKEGSYCIIRKDKILDYGKVNKISGSMSPDLDKKNFLK